MSRYILKDSESKQKFKDWLEVGLIEYGNSSSWAQNDEDSLCQLFFSCLSGKLHTKAATLSVNAYKVRGKGPGAKENLIGADNLIVVRIDTKNSYLSGFYLMQAKKARNTRESLNDVEGQCEKMVSLTAASQVAVLMPKKVLTTGAMAVVATNDKPRLSDVPYSNFARLLVEQNLKGLMLAPLDPEKYQLTDLYSEIDRVVSIIASEESTHEEVVESVEDQLEEAGLKMEKIDSKNPGL